MLRSSLEIHNYKMKKYNYKLSNRNYIFVGIYLVVP